MDAERIFHEAVDITDPAQRAAYLDRTCAGDDQLRSQVEALLRADARAGSFLEAPPAGAGVTLDQTLRIDGPGTCIGRYELLELIGEGGMGLVYLAEQKEPIRRRVALKIIKPGMDSRQVIARFEAERQALALLDHPNVAHVFDAGCTETGRPYFVMEYVKGLSITRYCDDQRLTIEQRLRLFEQVCEAVHHAHQKGIIHRDLKPSNILVCVHDDREVPKIIDFGIAKAITQPLTDKTFVTFQGQLLGTPEYMSPEQVDLATQDIDTRTDIYSLGVILYELLAGVLPFESDAFERAGLAEIQQTIREQEPASPSLRLTTLGEKAKTIAASRGTQVVPLARRLHRELEWIPLKAMRKDRCRRYRSASEMADDIRNYLTGLPLLAGPETTVYRVQKFVRKHAGSVVTVALVAVAIVLGLVVSTTLYFAADEARLNEVLARSRAERAETVAQEEKQLAEDQSQLAKTAAEALRRELYAAKMNLTQQAWDHSNFGRMRQLLRETEAYPGRGFEWYYWQRQTHLELLTVYGHAEAVMAIAYSPDGRRFVTGGDDFRANVWDAASGKELLTLKGHGGSVSAVAFSPDGQRIVTGSYDNTARVWEARSGKEVLTLRGHSNGITSTAFSPDGQRIVTASHDQTARIWEAASGKQLLTVKGHAGIVDSVTFSPDGQRIATGGRDGTAKVWGAATGKELITLRGHSDQVYSVAFSPDGQRIVTGSFDGTAKVWDLTTGNETLTLRGHNSDVSAVAFSPDGQRIVTGSFDAAAKVWDAGTGKDLFTLRGHSDEVCSVAFSPDGQRIVTGSFDKTAKVWEVASGNEVITLGHDRACTAIAFSPGGRRTLTGSRDGTTKVWETASGKELLTLTGDGGPVYAIAFSPDGQRTVTGSRDGTTKVWESATGKEELTLKAHKTIIQAVAISPDGQRVVTGSWDQTTKVWDAASGKELFTLTGHARDVLSVAISPDGQRIITGSRDRTGKVWEAMSGKELFTLKGHNAWVTAVGFSPDGQRIVTASRDGTARVWEATSGNEIHILAHNRTLYTVAFSPDGQRIVTGSNDGTAKVWETASGRELLTLTGHDGPIQAIASSPDGQRIVTGSRAMTVKVWETATPPQVIDWEQEDKAAEERLAVVRRERDAAAERERAVYGLNAESWKVISLPDGDPNAYRVALEKAQKARTLAPNDLSILNTLGVAQYRVGLYEDAFKTLTAIDKIRTDAGEPDVADAAFIAMSLHRLGRSEEARAALNRVHDLLKNERFADDSEVKAFLAEAEEMIEGKKP